MIIVFDCVGPKACCALQVGAFYKEVVFPNTLSQTVSSHLVPALEGLAKEAGGSLKDIQVVATTTGPGSFTGIRLGLATARGFQQATNCVLFTPTTLDVWCFGRWLQTKSATTVAIDSKRGDYFVQGVDAQFKVTQPPCVLPPEELPSDIILESPDILKTLLAYYDYCTDQSLEMPLADPFYLRTPTFSKQKRYDHP